MATMHSAARSIFLISFLLLSTHAWGATLDVYTLKNIVFPNVYGGNDIVADVTIDNNLFLTNPTPSETILITIRDTQGSTLAGWVNKPFPLPDFSGGKIQTTRIDIQPANTTTPFLNEGETYTLYATMEPFASETETSNNSGYQTFIVLASPQTFSIPDFPAWMSVLTLSIVLGWLFFSARKKSE